MRVVLSESWPIASLMVDMGMLRLLAMLAQQWRATYVVSGMGLPAILPMMRRWRFVKWMEFRYCRRSPLPGVAIIGRR